LKVDAGLLEALPLPTLVVEGDRITGANTAVGKLLGLPLEVVVGRTWLDLVAEQDRQRVRERQRRRLLGERVPETYELGLAGVGAAAIPVQMRVRLSGDRQLVQLLDLRHEARRRELLGALAGLGARLQHELSADAVARKMREGLLELGIRSTWATMVDGDVQIQWVEMGEQTSRTLLEAGLGRPIAGFRQPPTPLVDRVLREAAVFVDDWPTEAAAWFRLPVAEALRQLPPAGAYDHAIGLRIGDDPHARATLWAVGGWLLPVDLPAFRLLGQQMTAALAAARSIRALEARNAELASLNRVADAAAYAPSFEAFLARAGEVVREAVGCDGIVVRLVDEGRDEAWTVYATGVPPELAEAGARMPLSDPAMSVIVREGRPLVRHAGSFMGALAEPLRAAGVGTVVGVPLRFRSGVIGVLAVLFYGAARDGESRLDLLQAMASHFAAAVESHRLLDDLRRRVSELTLLNDVAVATGALDPVLLVDNALRRVSATLRAEVAVAYLSQGEKLSPVALQGITREQLADAPVPDHSVPAPTPERPVWAPGHPLDDARRRWFRDELGIEAMVGVPLLAKERVLGSLVLGRRRPEPFGDPEVRLLSAVGVQLGMAVDNARLFADTQRRLGDLEAVNSLALRVFTSAPGDAALLLDAACREIARALDAEAAVVLEVDRDGQRLVGIAAWGAPLPAEKLSIDLGRTPLAAEALRRQEPVWAPEVVLEAPDGAPAPGASPPLSVLFVPLTSRAATRGLVAIADLPSRRFDEAEVALAYALASEAGVGLENAELYAAERRRVQELSRLNDENAQLYDDLRRSYADLARAQEQLIQQERLAALGQLAAVVAHEVRNPLGVIFNSLGTIRRLVQPSGDAKMLLDIVGEEADRLNRIVGDLLDFARPVTPRLRPEPLDRVLDEAAAAALGDGASRVVLVRDLPPGLPPVPMDARLMRQVVLNVLSNAVQSMPDGGTLTVSARADEGAVRLEIADTGGGIPEEVRHRIFEPFFTTRPTGTGLGLAVVKRILDDHRAEVQVDSVERGGTRFVIRLPLDAGVENEPPPWSRSP
jgi:PAS domain S-box-containing protein